MRTIQRRAEEFYKGLEEGTWYCFLSYRGELVWSNDENKVWCSLLNDTRFDSKWKWNAEESLWEITLVPNKSCYVDEIRVEVLTKDGLIYERTISFAPIYIDKGDDFICQIKFEGW